MARYGSNRSRQRAKTVRDTKDRAAAAESAHKLLAQQPLFLDTETTGIRSGAEIVEISIIDHDGSTLIDTLVRPRGVVTPDSQAIHGITNQMLTDAPTWEDVWPEVEAALRGRAIGIFNADFDLRLMKQSHRAVGLSWPNLNAKAVCIMKLYARYFGEFDINQRNYRWQSLEKARRQCGLTLPNAHRAKADALLTRAVVHHMAHSDMPTA